MGIHQPFSMDSLSGKAWFEALNGRSGHTARDSQLFTLEKARSARGANPTPLEARTEWTVVKLPPAGAPRQRSTKTHGKPGYRTVGATWRPCKFKKQ